MALKDRLAANVEYTAEQALTDTLALWGVCFIPDAVLPYAIAKFFEFEALHWVPYPDASETLERLKRSGLILALLSYATDQAFIEKIAQASGIAEFLERSRVEGCLQFADERPDYYAAMRSQEMRESDPGEPQPEHGETWERLVRSVAACQAAGLLLQGDPMTLAVGMWSLVHGLADLWLTAPLSQLPQGAGGVRPLAEQVLRATLAAFASRGTPRPTTGLDDRALEPGGTD